MAKWILIIVSIIIVVFASLFFAVRYSIESNKIDGIGCLQNGHVNLAQHIHPKMSIIENGTEIPIPSNIGIMNDCMRWLHTHEQDGKIHLETTVPMNLTLGQFLSVWSSQGTNIIDNSTILNVTIDGELYNDYRSIILRDQQQIIFNVITSK